MSDSENEDGGGLGLGGILWGNLGEDDQVEVDYLDQVTCWVLHCNASHYTRVQEQPRPCSIDGCLQQRQLQSA
jgi:hypothetical protein